MKQTAVEWLVYVVQSNIAPNYIPKEIIKQAKKMEYNEKLKYQLFIGKVSEIIGEKKIFELLKECQKTIK